MIQAVVDSGTMAAGRKIAQTLTGRMITIGIFWHHQQQLQSCQQRQPCRVNSWRCNSQSVLAVRSKAVRRQQWIVEKSDGHGGSPLSGKLCSRFQRAPIAVDLQKWRNRQPAMQVGRCRWGTGHGSSSNSDNDNMIRRTWQCHVATCGHTQQHATLTCGIDPHNIHLAESSRCH